MGVAIHYKGNIKEYSLISTLCNEVADICRDMEWEYRLIKNTPGTPVWGIIFEPHVNCESVPLLFDKKGRLRSIAALPIYDETAWEQLYVAVKTQFTSPDLHIILVKLFRYLESRYFGNFEVHDDSDYWESSDKEALIELFEKTATSIKAVGKSLVEAPISDEELTEAALMEKIEEIFRRLGHESNEEG